MERTRARTRTCGWAFTFTLTFSCVSANIGSSLCHVGTYEAWNIFVFVRDFVVADAITVTGILVDAITFRYNGRR